MRVLILGWEYPPHITGGLGTACEGLTKALASQGVKIDFVVPKLHGDEEATHMRLLDAYDVSSNAAFDEAEAESFRFASASGDANAAHATTIRVQSILRPYLGEVDYQKVYQALSDYRAQRQIEKGRMHRPYAELGCEKDITQIVNLAQEQMQKQAEANPKQVHYGDKLLEEVHRYGVAITEAVHNRNFDVIHAHDWMTFPGAIALKAHTDRPLVVHVHSIEADRAGDGADNAISEIEKAGCEAADQVIAVSGYTKYRISQKYGIDPSKIQVVHNGIKEPVKKPATPRPVVKDEKNPIVLFLGRITFQKGPDYFLAAAKKVLKEVPTARFVVSGIGDMLPWMMSAVKAEGLQNKFEFTGFIPHSRVKDIFAAASVYVMPSISEPFGLTALEAVQAGTPVILSKQSGVSEVLSHSLKTDFWDVEKLAKMIVGAVKYPELRNDLVRMATQEIKRICWTNAASKTIDVYRTVLQH